MSYEDSIRNAYAALNGGDLEPFRELLVPEAQWLGIPGRGWAGETPI